MTQTATPAVHVLTGFLGSGKTTLLVELLGSPAFHDTAVIVNELGEIGLDHLLVSEQAENVALLEGGCLCCAVVDSLPETLLELCRKRQAGEVPPFARIVIETTGLADPGPILEVVRRSPLLAHFLVPGIVAVALDMVEGLPVLDRHPEARSQVVLADRIVLTKLDVRDALASAEHDALEAINPLAEVIEAAEVRGDPWRLLAPPLTPSLAQGSHSTVAHTHGVRAYSLAIEQEATRAGLAAFAKALELKLGAALLRCKGLVRTRHGAVLIQGVGTRFSFTEPPRALREAAPHVTCIVQDRSEGDVVSLLPWLHAQEGTLPPTLEDLR